MPQYLTQADIDQYGSDLADFSMRAAAQAVAPHLQNLQSQNAALAQRLAVEARRNLDERVEAAVPNYREIDRDPRLLCEFQARRTDSASPTAVMCPRR